MMTENLNKFSTRPSKRAETTAVRGVTIRPLVSNRGPDELAKNVFRLFYCLGVKCTDILQISVSTIECLATVTVRTEECESYLVAIFQDPATVLNQFDLRRITQDPRKLSVVRISEQVPSGIKETKLAVCSKLTLLADSSSSKCESSLHHPASGGPYRTDLRKVKHPLKVPGSRKRDLETAPIESPWLISQSTESSTNTMSFSPCGFDILTSEPVDLPDKAKKTSIAATSTAESPMSVRYDKRHKKVKTEMAYPENVLHTVYATEKKIGQNLQQSSCHNRTIGKKNLPFKVLDSFHCLDKERQGSVKYTELNHSKDSKDDLSKPSTTASEPAPGIPISRQTLVGSRGSSNALSSQMPSTSNNVPDSVIKVHAKTSTPAVPACGCPETVFYHLHQHVGAETRHAEFKRGGIVHDQGLFRAVVGKYMCGFLNSEGGTLYFGVSDDGKVQGIKADTAMEETLREDVDFAVRSLLEPSVDPSQYSVNFARIMKPNGQLFQDLRVMEVCVKPRRPPRSRRFSCRDVVYLRRDGSLQALPRTGRSTGS